MPSVVTSYDLLCAISTKHLFLAILVQSTTSRPYQKQLEYSLYLN